MNTIAITLLATALQYAVVGDTQTWVETDEGAFTRMTEALCTHPLDGVLFVGDMVDKGKGSQWLRVNEALDVLDACSMPYFLIYGNHDPKKDAAENFASRPYQPMWQLPMKKNTAPLYAHPLGNDWTVVGVPYKGKLKDESAAWVEALPGKLIWLHHSCYSPKKDTLKKCRLVGDVKAIISGHHKKSPRQSWRILDNIVGVFTNVQDAPDLEEWATLMTLYNNEICFSAWNPTTGETTYPGINQDKRGRFKIDPPNEPECFSTSQAFVGTP